MFSNSTEINFFNSKVLLKKNVASRANASILVKMDDAVLLSVVSIKDNASQNDERSFSVTYREKYSASSKIPSGFFKRESRSTEREQLISRFIDRSIRPSINHNKSIHISCELLSYDHKVCCYSLSVLASSIALYLSSASMKLIVVACSDKYLTASYTEKGVAAIDFSSSNLTKENIINKLKEQQEEALNVISQIKDKFKLDNHPETINQDECCELNELKLMNDALIKQNISNLYIFDTPINAEKANIIWNKDTLTLKNYDIFIKNISQKIIDINKSIKSFTILNFIDTISNEVNYITKSNNFILQSLKKDILNTNFMQNDVFNRDLLVSNITSKVKTDCFANIIFTTLNSHYQKQQHSLLHDYHSFLIVQSEYTQSSNFINKTNSPILSHLILSNSNIKNKLDLLSHLSLQIKKDLINNIAIIQKQRYDGRNIEEIRPINVNYDFLPQSHGSAMFARGKTTVLSTVTFGGKDEMQTIDNITGDTKEKFFLHYNFPQYSVNSFDRAGGTNRREIGHGRLAWKALKGIFPKKFHYTTRILSDVLSSDGSSSMATVCSAYIAMKTSGIPLEKCILGIAMGLYSFKKQSMIITDLNEIEDFNGSMDFKIAADMSEKLDKNRSITAIQMDIKKTGIEIDIIGKVIDKAFKGLKEIYKSIKEINKTEFKINDSLLSTTIELNENQLKSLIAFNAKKMKDVSTKTSTKISYKGKLVTILGVKQNRNNASDMIIKCADNFTPASS